MVILMDNILEYKGYYTKVQYSAEDKLLFGKIEGIRDLVNFECENVADVEKEFQAAVDDYLAFCDDMGQEPDKVYRGTFNVRIDPELHKAAAIKADKQGKTLNAFVASAIQSAVENDTVTMSPCPIMASRMNRDYKPVARERRKGALVYGE